jgi:hypothetical protein
MHKKPVLLIAIYLDYSASGLSAQSGESGVAVRNISVPPDHQERK